MNKPKPPQDFLSAIALRCEPLHPASLYRGDEFTVLQNDHHASNGFLEVNYGACQQAKSLRLVRTRKVSAREVVVEEIRMLEDIEKRL